MQTNHVFIGVDVSKDELVVAMGTDRVVCTLGNDAASISHWLKDLPSQALIAMESTGRYHGLLAHRAAQAGFSVFVLNARDVYFYARALGVRAKTDAVDAVLIARYLAEHHAQLYPWQMPSAVSQCWQDWLARRVKVVTSQTTLRQSFEGVDALAESTRTLLNAFDVFLKAIDRQVLELIGSEQPLAAGYRRLCSIPGIGPQTGGLLAALFSRFEFANADAVVAYSGMDPRPDESGKRRGQRRLSKRGPSMLRRQLYLAGFAATHSKVFKPLYQSLRAKGFASTEAIVILARRLLRLAFAI